MANYYSNSIMAKKLKANIFSIRKDIYTKVIFVIFVEIYFSMLIIGIAGGTGSGKTTVVHQIMRELPETEVGIISQDSYYKNNDHLSFEERALINFDHPQQNRRLYSYTS